MLNKKQEQIQEVAEKMFQKHVEARELLDEIEDVKIYNNVKSYLTDEFKEGFMVGFKALSSLLFFL